METKYWIGIDPGKYGGIAILDINGKIIHLDVITNELVSARNTISNALSKIGNCSDAKVFLESSISVGINAKVEGDLHFLNGFLYGCIHAINPLIEVIRSNPSHWKKVMHLSSDKQISINLAIKLYPEITKDVFFLHHKDGVAEAILLAHYGKELNKFYPESSQLKKIKQKVKQSTIKGV